ncbi:MAG: hypothetical protein DME26_16290 [Verrucomicrobia bacterium]|nr:MAG: hypothetical protein DME26_16290 [Verrucomicrobiota bacterium]
MLGDVVRSVLASDNCTPVEALQISQSPAPGTLMELGTHVMTVTVTDAANNSTTCALSFTVGNSSPAISSVTGPVDPLTKGSSPSVTVNFTDPDSDQEHTITFNWDDGSTTTASAGVGVGSVTGAHTYTSTGVYTVGVTVADACGFSASSVFQFVVVYDPNGGFVTGNGWINSSAGAYRTDPSLTGKATFGFVSKYLPGANFPSGNTEFQFHVANFKFKSTAYEWLVVAGAKAQYKGTGTVNGSGSYNFLLTATDGQASGGGGEDKFRLKITDANSGVIYDNVPGGSDDMDAANPQVLGGGSIVMHK